MLNSDNGTSFSYKQKDRRKLQNVDKHNLFFSNAKSFGPVYVHEPQLSPPRVTCQTWSNDPQPNVRVFGYLQVPTVRLKSTGFETLFS